MKRLHVSVDGSLENSIGKLVLISNLVRAVCNTEGSVRFLNYFTLSHQVCKDLSSTLIILCIFLCLRELNLELLDLILSFIFKGLRKVLSLHLLLQVSLGSAAL